MKGGEQEEQQKRARLPRLWTRESFGFRTPVVACSGGQRSLYIHWQGDHCASCEY
jgi:hypothetical protein